jgi:hypothetical protein
LLNVNVEVYFFQNFLLKYGKLSHTKVISTVAVMVWI